ncbi:MAG: hypothetical protein ACRDDY_11045 [Clostridium sp.]|uniref:hypothetical protein n=1 Tax=Clostridium sp. TaxID=1506 RepID=UPI003EE6C116
MKKVKLIILWVLISLVLQCGALFFLNNFYFEDDTNVNMQQISISDNMNQKIIHIEIPSDASNVGVSFDGVYLTYQTNGVYKIADSSEGKTRDLATSGNQVLCAKWLTGRDMLLNLQNNNGEVVLYSYDAQTGQNRKLLNIAPYSQSYVKYDIEASTITGVTYVQINNTIFRIDINQTNAQPIYPVVNQVGSMDTMPTQDRLVYVASGGNILHITQPSARITMNTQDPLTILGIDDNGIIYLGELQNGNVTSIVTKNLNDPNAQSKVISLKAPVASKDISVRQDGKIYVNYSGESQVEELSTQTVTKYTGQFLGFYQYGISTVKDGKYYKETFK